MSLHDVHVLDLSTSYAGALCSLHLADQKASVFHVRRDHLVRPYDDTFALSGKHVHRRKEGLNEDTLARLMPHIDVLIEDGPQSALSPRLQGSLQRAGVVHAWMPDHHPSDPMARGECAAARTWPYASGALEARMGLYETPLGRAPSVHHLALLDVCAAAWMSAAIAAALVGRERHHGASSLLLPRAEVAYPLLELQAMFTRKPPKTWPTLQWASTPFIAPYRARDGRYIYLHAGLAHHLYKLCDVLRALDPGLGHRLVVALSAETLEDPTSVRSLIEHHKIVKALEEIFKARTAQQWEELLSAAGLCAVRVRALEEWCALDHVRQSGQVIMEGEKERPGVIVNRDTSRRREPPYEESSLLDFIASIEQRATPRAPRPVTPSTGGERARVLPLDGIKVLDLTHVIAGPSATRLLAELGATVQRVENPHFYAPWVEAFHIAYNAGKTSVTLDLEEEEGRASLVHLLRTVEPDVIALNLRPGAGASAGLRPEQLAEHVQDMVYAHMTAYGEGGAFGTYPGWEQTAQAVTGVQLSWGADRGVPDLFALPFNDLCTGLHGGFAIACKLYERERARGAREQAPAYRVATADLTTTSIWMQALARYGRRSRPEHHERALLEGQSERGYGPLERLYRVRDGWGYMIAQSAESLFVVEGLAHLQGARGASLEASLEVELLRQTFATWRERFVAAGFGQQEVTWVKRRTQKEIFEDKWATRSGLVHARLQPALATSPGEEVTETSSPLLVDGRPVRLDPAPVREHAESSVPHASTASVYSAWLKDQARGALALGLTRRRQGQTKE